MGAKDEDFRGLGLTSRRNLCLHPEVSCSLIYMETAGKLMWWIGEQGEEREDCGLEV
jgi:hypothetical protein